MLVVVASQHFSFSVTKQFDYVAEQFDYDTPFLKYLNDVKQEFIQNLIFRLNSYCGIRNSRLGKSVFQFILLC